MISLYQANGPADKVEPNFPPQLHAPPLPRFAAIAIGRNEGERLKTCIASLSGAALIIYVDSGSTDDSVDFARSRGINVVMLDAAVPFTASRARNVGFQRLRT